MLSVCRRCSNMGRRLRPRRKFGAVRKLSEPNRGREGDFNKELTPPSDFDLAACDA